MRFFGKKAGVAVLAIGCAMNAALADPLSDLLAAGKGGACFDRVYDKAHLDKNPNQTTRSIRISLRDDPDTTSAIMRVAIIRRDATTHYIVGECAFAEEANLDVQGQPLIPAFKGPSGLDCHAMTSEDGASAEEGGDFPIDLKDGKSILLYLPDSVAAWSSFDRSEAAEWPEFGKDDQVFRLDRADASLCREIEEKLPWLL